jgi:hypothetical protein
MLDLDKYTTSALYIYLVLIVLIVLYRTYIDAFNTIYLQECVERYPERIHVLENRHECATNRLDFYIAQINDKKSTSVYYWDADVNTAVEKPTENRTKELMNYKKDAENDQKKISRQIALCSDFFSNAVRQV